MFDRVLHGHGDRHPIPGDGPREAGGQRGSNGDWICAQHVDAGHVEGSISHRHATRDVAVCATDVEMHRGVADDHSRAVTAPRSNGERSIKRRQVCARTCGAYQDNDRGCMSARCPADVGIEHVGHGWLVPSSSYTRGALSS